jgi:hypothetical protein
MGDPAEARINQRGWGRTMNFKNVLLRKTSWHVLRPVMRLINQYIEEKIRSATGLVPNTQYAEDDVFLVSYPKSGNTWFRNLVAGVIYGVDPEYAPYSLVSDLIPGHRNRYYKRYSTPMFFKSHYLPRPEYRRVVYVLRDGRDVIVSCFHHLRAIRGAEIDFLKVAQGEELLFPYYRWHEHVEAWLSNPYQAQMIVIRYEDLKRDAVHELRRFCEFVGVERDGSFLELMAQKASFEKMRQKEARYGIGNPNWPRDQFSVRRGQVGGYKEEMPPNVLAVFLQDAGDTLQKLGYWQRDSLRPF